MGFVKKRCFVLYFIFLSFFTLFTATYTESSVSSVELINNAKRYDGNIVVYQGEVVGERMCRKDGCWINLCDEAGFCIGIWIPDSMKFIPRYTGGYKAHGDIIKVEGLFHHSCKQHLGEMDIHAYRINRIKEGKIIPERISSNKIHLTIFIWSLLCLILILMKLKKI